MCQAGDMTLDTTRHVRDLEAQTDLLAAQLTPSALERRVPTCPEWTLRDLAVHLGSVQRWVGAIVAGRLTAPPPREVVAAPPSGGAAELAGWVEQGADGLREGIELAGPETPVWSWSGDDRVAFWARRMANEAAVHAVDAQLVTGSAAPLDPARAADGIEEWLWMLTLPRGTERSARYPVRPGGETLHVHATDPELTSNHEGEWTIRRTPDGIALERGHAKGDVALRGGASDLFLLLLRRLNPDVAGVEVLGDRTLLDEWLDHIRFE